MVQRGVVEQPMNLGRGMRSGGHVSSTTRDPQAPRAAQAYARPPADSMILPGYQSNLQVRSFKNLRLFCRRISPNRSEEESTREKT